MDRYQIALKKPCNGTKKTDRMEEHIDEVMRCFDFERVHEIMKFLNWKWFSPRRCSNDSCREEIPSIQRLREQALELLHEAVEYRIVGTGGFVAESFGDYLQLRFEAIETSSELLNDEN
jgi:hypothetical protein